MLLLNNARLISGAIPFVLCNAYIYGIYLLNCNSSSAILTAVEIRLWMRIPTCTPKENNGCDYLSAITHLSLDYLELTTHTKRRLISLSKMARRYFKCIFANGKLCTPPSKSLASLCLAGQLVVIRYSDVHIFKNITRIVLKFRMINARYMITTRLRSHSQKLSIFDLI